MISRLLYIIILAPLLAWASPADDAWDAWLAGDFDRVVKIAGTSGPDFSLPDAERARIYLALGCSEAMRGRDGAATSAFQHALSLNSNLVVTQDELPPPVWRVFSPLLDRSARFPVKSQAPPKEIVTRVDTLRIPVSVARSKLSAARSLVAPGWGHIVEGEPRGYWIAGVEGVLVAGWAATAMASSNARSDYLKARSSPDIAKKYKAYNTYYRMSWGFGLTALVVYIGAQYDFFTTPPNVQIGVVPDGANSMIALSLTL